MKYCSLPTVSNTFGIYPEIKRLSLDIMNL